MEELEDIQKKTFAKWLNSRLAADPEDAGARVTDLFYDLRDGLVLLRVVELLARERGEKEPSSSRHSLKRERGSLRVHHLSNVSTLLAALKAARVKLVNINNVDVVDGNPKITLALVWAIIQHWQLQQQQGSAGTDTTSSPHHHHHVSQLERSLLAWCRQSTLGYAGVDVRDLTTSWRDGTALVALLHRHRPELFDYAECLRQRPDPRARLEFAFGALESELGVVRLLDPEDLAAVDRPDKKSVMTYLMCVFQVLPHDDIDLGVLKELSSGNPGGDRDQLDGVEAEKKTPSKSLANGKQRNPV